MTKEDWLKVKDAWESPYSIRMKVDEHELSLYMRHHKMKMFREVFVDGIFKYTWCCKSKEGLFPDEGKRFFATSKKRLYSSKEVNEHQKIFGKKDANKMKVAVVEYKNPYWKSFNSFKKHLINHNKEIELIEC